MNDSGFHAKPAPECSFLAEVQANHARIEQRTTVYRRFEAHNEEVLVANGRGEGNELAATPSLNHGSI